MGLPLYHARHLDFGSVAERVTNSTPFLRLALTCGNTTDPVAVEFVIRRSWQPSPF